MRHLYDGKHSLEPFADWVERYKPETIYVTEWYKWYLYYPARPKFTPESRFYFRGIPVKFIHKKQRKFFAKRP